MGPPRELQLCSLAASRFPLPATRKPVTRYPQARRPSPVAGNITPRESRGAARSVGVFRHPIAAAWRRDLLPLTARGERSPAMTRFTWSRRSVRGKRRAHLLATTTEPLSQPTPAVAAAGPVVRSLIIGETSFALHDEGDGASRCRLTPRTAAHGGATLPYPERCSPPQALAAGWPIPAYHHLWRLRRQASQVLFK
jgi:hypothetical protein